MSIIENTLGQSEPASDELLQATAGLSRAKTAQYCAAALAEYRYLKPSVVFRYKAEHLAKSSGLQVWSPEFETNFRLWPVPEIAEELNSPEIIMVEEETAIDNRQLKQDEVRVRISLIQDKRQQFRWLDPMPKEEFEAKYRPERDFYSFKSIIGLDGMKRLLASAHRPGVPARARLKFLLMLGVPGVGKSLTMRCSSGEFRTPLTTILASNMYSKWLGETDKNLSRMLTTASQMRGILAIDEFQLFMPGNKAGSESGGVENRALNTFLTFFNDQTTNLVLAAANDISSLPDALTRSGRVDAIMFVGFPGKEAKQAAWKMYMRRHELGEQGIPDDDYWTPADIAACCRGAELRQESIREVSKFIVPSYEKNRKQMDELMKWAEDAGCVCAETGDRFRHPAKGDGGAPKRKVSRTIKTIDRKEE